MKEMFGAIIGDIVGSVYEWHNTKMNDFKKEGR
jgi:ADP-ribosylglycohydrolase